MVAAGDGADPELIALDLLAQAEHGEDSPVWLHLAGRRAARRGRRGASSGWRRSGRASRTPSCSSSRRATAAAALALAEQIAPEHLELVGEEAEALADRVRERRLPVRRRGAGHRVRRLRRRLEPRAAHRRRRALPVGAVAGHVPAADGSRILARARPPPASRPPARPWRAPRASLCTPSPWSAAREPHRADPPHHRRDRRPAVARPRRHRRGRAHAPASASSTTCSTRSRATAGSTST